MIYNSMNEKYGRVIKRLVKMGLCSLKNIAFLVRRKQTTRNV